MNKEQSNKNFSLLGKNTLENLNSDWDREKQTQKNQSALKWLQEKREQELFLNQEELEAAKAEFKQLKQIIDENRNRQLFGQLQ